MLRFFRARPPLTTGQRVNIELLMRRTIEAAGADRAKSAVFVRDISELDIDLSDTETLLKSAEQEIHRRFPPLNHPVAFERSKELADDAASHYEWHKQGSTAAIYVADRLLEDPLRTTVEMANQLANHFWHASGSIEHNEIHPNLTELLPVCCGFSVLVSDAAFYDAQSSTGGWHHWTMSRSGYYNATEIGYASALLARFRGETEPAWINAMRLDSRDVARQAIRYWDSYDQIQRPLLFDAERVPSSQSNPTELADWLRSDDSTWALAAGYALQMQSSTSPRVTEAAIHAVNHSDLEVAPVAIRLLGKSVDDNGQVRALIERKIASKNEVISIAAIQAAADLGYPLRPYRRRIAEHLKSFAAESASLVNLIASGEEDFESLQDLVAQHLGEAVLYGHESAIESLLRCLRRISKDPLSVIERQIRDDELRRQVLELWETN